MREQLLQAARRHPEDASEVYEALVRGYAWVGQFDGALMILGRWVEQFPRDWRGHLWRGAVFEHLGLVELSVGEYQAVLKSRPDSPPARKRLGLALAKTGYDFKAALECLEAVDCDGDADLLVAKAVCRRALGEIDKARRLTEAALAIDAEHYRGLRLAALLRLQAGDNEAALELAKRLGAHRSRMHPREAVQRLLKLEPVAFPVYDTQAAGEVLYLEATALKRLGKDAQAGALLGKLQELQDTAAEIKRLLHDERAVSSDPAVWRRLGELYTDIGFKDDARMWLSRALEADPGDSEARNALGRLETRRTYHGDE
jgi:tetratricopeptide (TPR) repeat protein